MCTNPHCFEDTCKGECVNINEVVESHDGNKIRENKWEEPEIEPTPLRSKYIYTMESWPWAVSPSQSKT